LYNEFTSKPLTTQEIQAMAHSNTVFYQLLNLIDRHDFQKLENGQFRPKRKYRTLTRWGQFAAMLFAQITGRSSLRDIADSLQAQTCQLYHLGIGKVKKSTLADANNKRTAEFFQAFFDKAYQRCASLAPGKKKFKFKNKLYSLDASTIDLCLSLFPWAKFRSTKGGIKLHALLDHEGYIPAFATITDAKTSDLAEARKLVLPPGSIVAADRAYIDFSWLMSLNKKKCFLVTRLKKNIKFKVTERRSVLKNKGLTCDQTVLLTGTKASECPIPLRRIGYRDPETGKHYVFLTNNFHLAAKTIADIYKSRWEVELFFKWIKQNLKVKSFLGTSENAVMTQIYVALVTMLLLSYMKFLARLGISITKIQKLLQLNLFRRQSMWELFDPPPTKHEPPSRQILLFKNSYL
jgi:putative transposase